MVKFRLMVNAILLRQDTLLMMKRASTRYLSPNKWGGIGGHVEPSEISNPHGACLREIEEETGILPEEIDNFRLQYLIIRRKDDEIRQQFMYTGQIRKTELRSTREGELHFVPLDEVLMKDLPYVYRETLTHYFEHGPSTHVWIGSAGVNRNAECRPPCFQWATLIDPVIV